MSNYNSIIYKYSRYNEHSLVSMHDLLNEKIWFNPGNVHYIKEYYL